MGKKDKEETLQLQREESQLINQVKGALATSEILSSGEKKMSREENIKKKLSRENEKLRMREKKEDIVAKKMNLEKNGFIQHVQAMKHYFYGFAYNFGDREDLELYDYKRKLRSEMQWQILKVQHVPVGLAYGMYRLTKRMKNGTMLANLMFFGTWVYSNYAIQNMTGNATFELSFPPHPKVLEERKKVIQEVCFYNPAIIKNEIEFMLGECDPTYEFHKEFTISDGLRYEIVLKESSVFVNCIDSFEDILGLSSSILEDNDFLDILDPNNFSEHEKIIGSMLEMVSIAQKEYAKTFKPNNKLKEKAMKKLTDKYDLKEAELEEAVTQVEKKHEQKKKDIMQAVEDSLKDDEIAKSEKKKLIF